MHRNFRLDRAVKSCYYFDVMFDITIYLAPEKDTRRAQRLQMNSYQKGAA